MGDLTDNFSEHEFFNPRWCDGLPGRAGPPWYPSVYSVTDRAYLLAADTLEPLRKELGRGFTSTPNGGYRTPEQNRAKHGARHSQHLLANAFDCKGLGKRAFLIAEDLMIRGVIPKGGLGSYWVTRPNGRRVYTFLHIDNRGTMARWRARP